MDIAVMVLGSFCGIIYIMYRYGQEELDDRWGCFKVFGIILGAMFLIIPLPVFIAEAIFKASDSMALGWIYIVLHLALVGFVIWKLWHKDDK